MVGAGACERELYRMKLQRWAWGRLWEALRPVMRNLDFALGSGGIVLRCVSTAASSSMPGVLVSVLRCHGSSALGIRGLSGRAAAGAARCTRGQETCVRAVAPTQRWVPGTRHFASVCLNLHFSEMGGTIVPQQPNPRGCSEGSVR